MIVKRFLIWLFGSTESDEKRSDRNPVAVLAGAHPAPISRDGAFANGSF